MIPQPAKPIVDARDISYRIGDIPILDSVDLAVDRGEFLGVIGPNGAGKTTLLKIALGVLHPSSGSIRLDERDIALLKPKERARIAAYLSQDISPSFPYPVFDIVLMGRYPYVGRFGREADYDTEIVRRALDYVGLSGFEDRFYSELSGGEQQMVLFAKVLAQEARVLVLDEPTSNLDIKHQDQFFSMARELTKEGRAVVAAVHNLDVASRYCDRLILLDHGKVVASGAPADVLRTQVLDEVYHTRTAVTRNATTGTLIVNVLPIGERETGVRCHLIGGAGSAMNLTRELVRFGYTVTGGIAHEGDADETLWSSLGIEYVSVHAFDRIDAETIDRASKLVREADVAILCDFPVGPGNAGNLELAARAPNLLVVTEREGGDIRDFFIEEGRERFEALTSRGVSVSYRRLVDAIGSGELESLVSNRGDDE